MSDTRETLRRGIGDFSPRPDAFRRVLDRRDARQRNRRIRAGVVALLVAVAGTGALVRAFSAGPLPASDPRSAFVGIWITPDADGSPPTMTAKASGDETVEITVLDDAAKVCSGAPSTMTGTGRLDGAGDLVIPSPVYTCGDGSEPDALSGPPLAEQLRNLSFVSDVETDALTDTFGAVWERSGGEDPSPQLPMSGAMWPQSNMKEVRKAQELADAGDPRYTWQVDPELRSWWKVGLEDSLGDAEIVARFLREELGWEEFRYSPIPEDGFGEGTHSNAAYIRCAPGRTGPLYPARACAPTIDEARYEMVSLDLAQLVRQDRSGIWVVVRWKTLPPRGRETG